MHAPDADLAVLFPESKRRGRERDAEREGNEHCQYVILFKFIFRTLLITYHVAIYE